MDTFVTVRFLDEGENQMKKAALVVLLVVTLYGCATSDTQTFITPIYGARQTHTVEQARIICSAQADDARKGSYANSSRENQIRDAKNTIYDSECSRSGSRFNCMTTAYTPSGGAVGGFFDSLSSHFAGEEAANQAAIRCLAEMGYKLEKSNTSSPGVSRMSSADSSKSSSNFNGDANNPRKQMDMAVSLWKEKRYTEAMTWAEKAAYQNHPPALALLADLHLRTTKDASLAYYYAEKSMRLGSHSGYLVLGKMYFFGTSRTPRDTEHGLSLIRKAGALGNKDALAFISRYEEKNNRVQDDVK